MTIDPAGSGDTAAGPVSGPMGGPTGAGTADPAGTGEPAPPGPVAGGPTAPGPDEPTRPSSIRSIVEWVVVIGGALVVALVIRTFLFTTFWIPSASMEPTLIGEPSRHDRVVVNRLSYKVHHVNRGDVVVFEKPDDEPVITENGREVKDLIKRVVGLPGETVTLEDGKVYIDGKLLSEPYLPKGTPTEPICSKSQFKVPAGHVLVMGDNRTNSKDGRCFGPIDEDAIVGRAFVRIWPLSHINWL